MLMFNFDDKSGKMRNSQLISLILQEMYELIKTKVNYKVKEQRGTYREKMKERKRKGEEKRSRQTKKGGEDVCFRVFTTKCP